MPENFNPAIFKGIKQWYPAAVLMASSVASHSSTKEKLGAFSYELRAFYVELVAQQHK